MKIESTKKAFAFKFVTIAIIIIIILFSVNKLYKSLYGTFSDFNMNTGSLAVTDIYKSNDKFLLFDEASGSAAIAKYDDKKRAFIEIKSIKNEISIFNHVLQLNDGKILFYYFNDKPTKRKLIFTIYNLEKEAVLNQITFKNNTDFWHIENIWAIGKDNFAFLIGKEEKNEKTENQELYIFKDGKIKRIKNTFEKNEGYKNVINIGDDIFIFDDDAKKDKSLSIFKFNQENNDFTAIDLTSFVEVIKKSNTEKSLIYSYKVIPLSDYRFLYVQDNGDFVCTISLFQIANNEIKEIFTKNFGMVGYVMANASFIELDNNKILITGGDNNNPVFYREIKNTYKLDIETGQLTRLNSPSYSASRMIKLNKNNILLLYGFEIFKKGILW